MLPDGLGAVVEAVERRDDATAARGTPNLSGSLAGNWVHELCLGKEKSRSIF